MYSAKTYWRDRLPPNLKKTYDSIADAVERGSKTCPAYSSNGSELLKCFEAFTCDNPQYFWVSPQFSTTTSSHGGTKLTFDWLYSSLKIASMERECKQIAFSVHGSSTIETERKIVEYIVRNVSYEINNKFNQNMISALYYKKAQCSGISAAVKYLCDKNGIWCIIVTGKLNGPHAWNIVCIDGNYYHVDATCTLGSNAGNPQNIWYANINSSDSDLAADYTWDRSSVPACPQSLPLTDNSSNAGNSYNAGGSRPTGGNSYQRGGSAGNSTAHQPHYPIPSGTDVFTNMSEFRIAITKILNSRQQQYSFAITTGSSQQERMKLVMSSIKMVAGQLNIGMSYSVNITDTLCNLKIQYK